MAIKKFPHAVIYKGVLYMANTEIEVEEEKVATKADAAEAKDQEEKAAEAVEEKVVTKNEKRASRKA